MIDPILYDKARDQLAVSGFTPEIQSRIAFVLWAVKNGNLLFQSQAQWLPNLGVTQQFFITQASRELEAITLLGRTTQWSNDSRIAFEAQRLVSPLVTAWSKVLQFPGILFNPPAVYRGISLGHAQLAHIRLLPIIPDNVQPLMPFVVALQRIEQENARMLQTQIHLLKHLGSDLPLDEREAFLEQDQMMVDSVFSNFLVWLAQP